MNLYLIPLLLASIMRDEKISTLMESRGFGKFKERSNYNEVEIRKKGVLFIVAFLLF